MQKFVDLGRQFRALTSVELEQPEYLASLADSRYLSGLKWSDLLSHSRVLLLAEAGSGKTVEMRNMAKMLRSNGQYAFFVPIETLDQRGLPGSLLSADEQRNFLAWKQDQRSIAWFFLDAVDELKLTQRKLERSLSEFAKSVDGLLDRVKVMLSCRPNDWRPEADMAIYKEYLPRFEPTHAPNADEVFEEMLSAKKQGQKALEPAPDVLTVMLLPLANSQIQAFAQHIGGLQDVDAFAQELANQNAWTFARRPMDLSDLIASWKRNGALGTRIQQHEANIESKLLDDPERPDGNVLSDEEARVGAERLALALVLTRTRTIRAPDQTSDAESEATVLDAQKVLPDWTPAKRGALLRRALFDPATYGRIRFHHRSVQDYLAARRLKALREGGMTVKALLRLLVAEPYGERIVIPSMRPIAAWLALWIPEVRRAVIDCEPETLLSEGDPAALAPEVKVALVRSFAKAYGEGSWRGIDIPIDEVRRLASPHLGPVVREIWNQNHANPDVSEFLLQLLWQTREHDCSDVAEEAAFDGSLPYGHRVVAIRALVEGGDPPAARRVVDSMLADGQPWPPKVIQNSIGDLFPKIATAKELVALLARTEGSMSANSVAYQLQYISTTIDPWSPQAVELREGLVELLWRGRSEGTEFYNVRSAFGHLAEPLAVLVTRQIPNQAMHGVPLAKACALAYRFGKQHKSGVEKEFENLYTAVRGHQSLREAVFWADLEAMDAMVSAADAWHRFYNATHDGLTRWPEEGDRSWPQIALANTAQPSRQEVALEALAQLWRQQGYQQAELAHLTRLTGGDPKLLNALTRWTAAPEIDERHQKWEQDNAQRNEKREQAERERIEGWKVWRRGMLADLDGAFATERVAGTLWNLYKWLGLAAERGSSTKRWNRLTVVQVFGDDFCGRTVAALKAYWRALKNEDLTPGPPPLALCAIAAESETPNWSVQLSKAEAAIAIAVSSAELNGFAEWLTDLAKSHPAEVKEYLSVRLRTQISNAPLNDFRVPILQDLRYASTSVKMLVVEELECALTTFPEPPNDQVMASNAMYAIDHLVDMLVECAGAALHVNRSQECLNRFALSPRGLLALQWLKGALLFDFSVGAQAAIDELQSPGSDAVSTLVAIFKGHEGIPIRIQDRSKRVKVLGELVRITYERIRVSDDQQHDDVYSPDARDRAQEVRSFLLKALLDTPGPEARQELLALSSEPIFSHMPDRLRRLTRERAAAEAEPVALSIEFVRELDTRLEAPPLGRDGLFAIMADRIDDLAFDIAHHDFTDRRTLQSIDAEIEMQRTLARRLEASSLGAYTVSREDEAADLKKTDIRLTAQNGEHRAVIEIKIGDDRWSLAQLEHSLEHQLVGQYLRHDRTRAGCMLLTYNGKTSTWSSGDGTRLTFDELVEKLRSLASSLERIHSNQFRLTVIGVDLRDPLLVPAKRVRGTAAGTML